MFKIFSGIDVKGIILIAPEGININISVKESEYEIIEKKLKKNFLIIKMKILKQVK